MIGLDINVAYTNLIRRVMAYGAETSPRGQKTREALSCQSTFAMTMPVISIAERQLNYSFMAAEAEWILDGRSDVESVAKHNRFIAQFSDDGKTFAGAYGPRFAAQFEFVLDRLKEDRDTRQAVMTFWIPNGVCRVCKGSAHTYEHIVAGQANHRFVPTKDVPCTVALAFMIREDKLHLHVFMRSSDIFLGIPYDWFSFSMIAARFIAWLPEYNLKLGNLYFTAASQHAYERDFEKLYAILKGPRIRAVEEMPDSVLRNWTAMSVSLVRCREKTDKDLPPELWRIRPLKEVS